jgi:hypothetical protein
MHPLGCRKTLKPHENIKNTGARFPGASRRRRRWPATTAAGSDGTSKAAAAASSKDNPDLDEIVLDDAYYQEIGMTREQAMRQQQEVRQPAGVDVTLLATSHATCIQSWCTAAVQTSLVYRSSL